MTVIGTISPGRPAGFGAALLLAMAVGEILLLALSFQSGFIGGR